MTTILSSEEIIAMGEYLGENPPLVKPAHPLFDVLRIYETLKYLQAENAELKKCCDEMVPIVQEYTNLMDTVVKRKVTTLMKQAKVTQ